MGFFQNEEEEDLLGNIAGTSGAAQPSPQVPIMQPQAAPQMNPTVRDYLLKRKAERDALQTEVKDDADSPNISAALAAIGAGFQKKDSLAAGMSVLDAQEKSRKSKLTDFDTATDRGLSENTLMDEEDPSSEQSKMADRLARKMGYKGGPVSAAQFKKFSPAMEKMLDLEARTADRAEARAERRYNHGIASDERMTRHEEQDMQKLSKDVAGAQDVIGGLDEVEKELGFTLDEAETSDGTVKVNGKEKDLPGVSLPLVGRVSAYSDKARNLQSAAGRVFNSVLKDRSGAAVSNSELERLKMEFGQGKFNSEPELVGALQRYKRAVANELKNREAAYNPKIVAKYGDQGGRTSHSLGQSKAPTASAVPMKGKDGKTKLIPAEQVAAAEAQGAVRLDKVAGQ